MNKYIMGIFAYQCIFPENTNNLQRKGFLQNEKGSLVENFIFKIGYVLKKTRSKENVVLLNKILSNKKGFGIETNNVILNKIVKHKSKKFFFCFLGFVMLLILIYICFPFFGQVKENNASVSKDAKKTVLIPENSQHPGQTNENEENSEINKQIQKSGESHPGQINENEENSEINKQIQKSGEEDFVEKYKELEQKNLFILIYCKKAYFFDNPNQYIFTDENFYLFEKKEEEYVYYRYDTKTIFLENFVNKICGVQNLLRNFIDESEQTIIDEKQEKKLMPIDYGRIIEAIKPRFICCCDCVIFCLGEDLVKISVADFNRKKNKYKIIEKLTKSKDEFLFICQFFYRKMTTSNIRISAERDLTSVIVDLLETFPEIENIKNIKKYGLEEDLSRIPNIILDLDNNMAAAVHSSLGDLIKFFCLFVSKNNNIFIKIEKELKKEIRIGEDSFLEISRETIDLLEEELKDVVFLNEIYCYNVWGSKSYHSSVDIKEAMEKLKKEQEEKINQHFEKYPITGEIKIQELARKMCDCLLHKNKLKTIKGFDMEK